MTQENLAALQDLIQADPALTRQLQSATSINSAAQLLAQAANQKGIGVDSGAIAEYIDVNKTIQVTDSELETLAGGKAMRPSIRPRNPWLGDK